MGSGRSTQWDLGRSHMFAEQIQEQVLYKPLLVILVTALESKNFHLHFTEGGLTILSESGGAQSHWPLRGEEGQGPKVVSAVH